MNFEALLEKVTHHIEQVAKTDTVVGEPFKLGDFTCVPIIKMGVGFGTGGGSGSSDKTGEGSGGGAGGAVGVEPLAFLVSKGDEISLLNVGRAKGLQAIFEKAPDLMDKILEMKKKKEEDGGKKK